MKNINYTVVYKYKVHYTLYKLKFNWSRKNKKRHNAEDTKKVKEEGKKRQTTKLIIKKF